MHVPALFMAAVLGVSVGWQPLPGGNPGAAPGYECVVHVDPQTAGRLARGEAERLAGEVPADVAPIERVRVVVSSEPAPRRRAVTLLKPILRDDASGVHLTQYNQVGDPGFGATPLGAATASADSRYPGASGIEQTAAGSVWNAQDNSTPFAAVPGQVYDSAADAASRAAERVRTAGQTVFDGAGNTLRTAAQSVPTPQQLFGGTNQAASTWNGSSVVTEPIRSGVNQLDEQVRTAASGLGDRTRGLIDELGRPLSTQGAAPAAAPATAYPPQPQTTAAAGGSTWNSGVDAQQGSAPPFVGSGLPANNQAAAPAGSASNSWNAGAPAANTTAPIGARLNEPFDAGQAGRFGGNSLTTGAAGASALDSRYSRGDDRWATAAPEAPGASLSNPNVDWGDDPRTPTPANGTLATGAGTPAFSGNPVSPPLNMPGPAAVGAGALGQSPDRPLEDPAPAAPMGAPGGVFAAAAGTAPVGAAVTPTVGVPPTSFGTALGASAQATTAESAGNKLAALAAWVLLTGSAAGNCYLFWSYLDVRQKYRALVRKTARAVGSRFSAA